MTKKIAILRGINVGGKRSLPMEDLRALFEKLGFSNVETYIQSGNVIFDVAGDMDHSVLSDRIEKAIENTFGYDVPIIIRTPLELETAIQQNPFYKDDKDINSLHLTFLGTEPGEEVQQKIEAYSYEPDRFVINGKEVYIYCEGKYHQTKLSNTFFEKKLGVPATTRNWNTILALQEKCKQM